MTTTFNRQIKTGFNQSVSTITLKANRAGEFEGKTYSEGDTQKHTRIEAGRIIKKSKGMFTPLLD